MNQILNECRLVLTKKDISKKNLQSLIGLLMFVHNAVKPASIFVNRLLLAIRQCEGHSIHVTVAVVCDIS